MALTPSVSLTRAVSQTPVLRDEPDTDSMADDKHPPREDQDAPEDLDESADGEHGGARVPDEPSVFDPGDPLEHDEGFEAAERALDERDVVVISGGFDQAIVDAMDSVVERAVHQQTDVVPEPDETTAVQRPPLPERPAEWVTRGLALRWLDFGLYQVERVLVVSALLLMSLMMFLEMLYLSMVSEDSRLAAFFVGWGARFSGGELQPSTVATVTDVVVVAELALIALGAFVATSWRLREKALGLRLGAAAIVLGVLYGFTTIVRTQPSPVAYSVLLVGALVGTAASWRTQRRDDAKAQSRRDEKRRVFLALVVASPVLFWLIADLPDDYSFAQSRSLFLLLWVGFLGSSMATYQKAHLRIDFVRKLVRGNRASHVYAALSTFVTLLFVVALLYVAWDYVFNPETGARSVQAEEGTIPDWVKVLAIPLSLATMALRLTLRTVAEAIAAAQGAPAEASSVSAH